LAGLPTVREIHFILLVDEEPIGKLQNCQGKLIFFVG
jgi:hypothetical protein